MDRQVKSCPTHSLSPQPWCTICLGIVERSRAQRKTRLEKKIAAMRERIVKRKQLPDCEHCGSRNMKRDGFVNRGGWRAQKIRRYRCGECGRATDREGNRAIAKRPVAFDPPDEGNPFDMDPGIFAVYARDQEPMNATTLEARSKATKRIPGNPWRHLSVFLNTSPSPHNHTWHAQRMRRIERAML